MTAIELEQWILKNFSGINVIDTFKERSFFYNPNAVLPKGIYFATIKINDGPNDNASDLNRDEVYRLSIGVGKKYYQSLFGKIPERPLKGNFTKSNFDFKTLNLLMPHPIYAWMGWVCINCPSNENLKTIKLLLDISYENAIVKHTLIK